MMIHVVSDASYDPETKRAVGAAQILKHPELSIAAVPLEPEEVLLEQLGVVRSSLVAEILTSVLATRTAQSYGLPIVVHSDLHGIKKWVYNKGKRPPIYIRGLIHELVQMNPVLVVRDANNLKSYQQCHEAAYRQLFGREPRYYGWRKPEPAGGER